jgi:hypothetical protein
MLRQNHGSPDLRTPPAGVLPCVWMSAGLVAYKLCDRGFECDGCPFDQAMRGSPPRRAPASSAAGWGAPGWGAPAFRVARPAAAGS